MTDEYREAFEKEMERLRQYRAANQAGELVTNALIEIATAGNAFADADGVIHDSRTYRVESTDDETTAYVKEVCERQLFREFSPGQLRVSIPNPPIEIAPGIYQIEVAFEILPSTDADTPLEVAAK